MDERDEEEEKLRKNALHATYGQLLNDYRDKTKIALELQRAVGATLTYCPLRLCTADEWPCS